MTENQRDRVVHPDGLAVIRKNSTGAMTDFDVTSQRCREPSDSHAELCEEIGGMKSVNSMLCQALKSLTLHARTTGGTAGPDAALMLACEKAEHALSIGGIGKSYMEGADAASEQIRRTDMIHCSCGDAYPSTSYGAGFIDGSGMCPNCDAAIPARDIPAPPDSEVEALRKDAERYRWLRRRIAVSQLSVPGAECSNTVDGIDSGIDAAMERIQ
jgi:hypothetical protein